MGIIQRFKELLRRMLGKDQVSKLFGIDNVYRSAKMDKALKLYDDMRRGKPYWCTDDIRTVRFSNTICKEIANLATFNIEMQVTGSDVLQRKVNDVMNVIQQKQEECCSTCGMMVKSSGEGVEFLTPDNFLITETDVSGNARAAVFFAWIKRNDTYYVKAEYHRYEGEDYRISVKAYRTQNLDVLGDEISLKSVEEWKDIQPETQINDLEYPLFVYWKTPFANTIDPESPLCVPEFAEAIEELRWLDIAMSLMGAEQEDSKHITFVSESAVRYAGQHGIDLPRFIRGMEFGTTEDNTIHEHVPTMLVTDRVSAINFYLSVIGYKCGFSNGYFSFDESRGIQTATQVEADDRRTLQTVQAFRNVLDGKNHDGVLHRLVYILYVTAVGNGEMPATNYTVECMFDDLTNNPDEDRARWWNYVIQGKVPAWMYFVKFEGMNEAEAKAMIEEAQPDETTGFFQEEE